MSATAIRLGLPAGNEKEQPGANQEGKHQYWSRNYAIADFARATDDGCPATEHFAAGTRRVRLCSAGRITMVIHGLECVLRACAANPEGSGTVCGKELASTASGLGFARFVTVVVVGLVPVELAPGAIASGSNAVLADKSPGSAFRLIAAFRQAVVCILLIGVGAAIRTRPRSTRGVGAGVFSLVASGLRCAGAGTVRA